MLDQGNSSDCSLAGGYTYGAWRGWVEYLRRWLPELSFKARDIECVCVATIDAIAQQGLDEVLMKFMCLNAPY